VSAIAWPSRLAQNAFGRWPRPKGATAGRCMVGAGRLGDQGPGATGRQGSIRRLPPGNTAPCGLEAGSGPESRLQGHGVDGDDPFPVSHGSPHRRCPMALDTLSRGAEATAAALSGLAVVLLRPMNPPARSAALCGELDLENSEEAPAALIALLAGPPPLASGEWIRGVILYEETLFSRLPPAPAKRAPRSSIVSSSRGFDRRRHQAGSGRGAPGRWPCPCGKAGAPG